MTDPPKRRRRFKPSVKDPSGLTIRSVDMDRARPLRWLWAGRLLIGYLNLMIGNEGVGKGNLIAWVIARITRGELPGEFFGEPRSVAVVGDEDSWDDIWSPRFEAANADLGRIYLIEAGTEGTFDVTNPADIKALMEFIVAHDLALVYFDQLLDNLGYTDSWKDKQVRMALAPLRKVAADTESAMLMSMHPNKKKGSFRDMISGTPAFNALARSSLLVAEHPHIPEFVAVARAKGNYSKLPSAFEFRIMEVVVIVKDSVKLITSRITAERENPALTSNDLLDQSTAGRARGSERHSAKELLARELADHERHRATELFATLEAAGFSKTTIRNAAGDLGLIVKRIGGFKDGYWTWRLP